MSISLTDQEDRMFAVMAEEAQMKAASIGVGVASYRGYRFEAIRLNKPVAGCGNSMSYRLKLWQPSMNCVFADVVRSI